MQILTAIAKRFSFRQIDLFNPDPVQEKKKRKSSDSVQETSKKKKKKIRKLSKVHRNSIFKKTKIEDLDSDDEFAGVDVESMPRFRIRVSKRLVLLLIIFFNTGQVYSLTIF